MPKGTIHRLIELFEDAFHQLGYEVALDKLESLAVMVHKAMTVQARNFHNLEHVFNFVIPSDPIQTLAALFHDIVYFQVDQGFLPEIEKIVAPYIREVDGNIYIVDQIPLEDWPVWLALDVFDLKCGGLITPWTGLNEFLSAVVMNKSLEGVVSEKNLLTMTLCVEATIPFRSLETSGECPFDRLAERVRRISDKWQASLGKDEIEDAIRLAVAFANKDVENFAEDDPVCFLDNTWKLLPETNVALRSRDVYTVREYRQAIQKMEAFLSNLNPDHVFHQYAGVPDDDEFNRLSQRAHRNIETARQYLQVKLLAQAILDALAEMSGGDAPLSLFMGDLPKEGEESQRLENFLPPVDDPEWLDTSSTIYRLLEAGWQGNAGFDLRTAPLTLFLYKVATPGNLQNMLSATRKMLAGESSAHEFLLALDPYIRQAVARACAEMAITRRERLLQYAA